jgi:hypothetical protein
MLFQRSNARPLPRLALPIAVGARAVRRPAAHAAICPDVRRLAANPL